MLVYIVDSVSECNPKLCHKLEQCTGTFGIKRKQVDYETIFSYSRYNGQD